MNPQSHGLELPETARLRRAALALHALNEADLHRVWARLTKNQHTLLSPLLQELVSLGIPKGHHWLKESVLDIVPAEGEPLRDRTPRSMIRGLTADQLIDLLKGQSLDTVAAIVASEAWPWQASLLERWPVEQRHALNSRVNNPGQPSVRFIEQLLCQLSSRVLVGVPAAPSESSHQRSVPRP
ncbi:MAG: hypothetical protein RJB60_1458 [Pseudomonadota bacterium]|jgi:flagellar motor switch protein FliG